jgi:hypothetical protein|tara:strand:- start:2388 stop:2573 length:186 start_codon:yes stop_codon:yes gene_type:complete
MAQEIQGYFLTKKELKAINFLLEQSIKRHEEILALDDIEEIKNFQIAIEFNISSAIRILNY